MKYMRKAELQVQLKPGTLGVKVRIMPPEAKFPDQVQIVEEITAEEEAEEAETEAAGAERAEKAEE